MPGLAGRDAIQPMPLKQFRSVYAPEVQDLMYDGLDKLAEHIYELLCEIRHRRCIAARKVCPDLVCVDCLQSQQAHGAD